MKKQTVARWAIYIGGLLFLAAGLILNTKTDFGVSPIISVSYTVSRLTGWNFGNTTLIWYILLAGVEYALKGRGFRPYDLLQIPLSAAFTRVMNLFSALLPDVQGLGARTLCLALAIVCAGVGAAMSLDMRLVPNPGDGVVQAIADFSGKRLGLCKNCVDAGCIAASLALGLAFSGSAAGLGLGTLASMAGVGRVVALFQRFFGGRVAALAGLEP